MNVYEAVSRVDSLRELAKAHDHMMTRATVIYNRVPWAIGKQDLERNRVEIGQALVGEHLEGGRP